MSDISIVIKSTNGEFFVELNGAPIMVHQFEEVSTILRDAYRQQRRRETLAKLNNLLSLGNWVFPTSRRDVFASGGCVYFAQSCAMPGLVKIGQSTKLSTRTKTLSREYGAEVKALAFVKSSDHKNLEKALHFLFAEYRQGESEWFEERPILEFIQGFKS